MKGALIKYRLVPANTGANPWGLAVATGGDVPGRYLQSRHQDRPVEA